MGDNDIKLVDSEDTVFAWLKVTGKAKEVFSTGLFDLYALYDDDTESLIESIEVLNKALENNLEIGIEVGHIKREDVGTVSSIITLHLFEEIRQKVNNGTIAAHEHVQKIAIDFEVKHAHITDWEEHRETTECSDWEECIIKFVKENYLK